jgi:Ubiquinone biosynthesis protein COQ7
MDLGDRIIKVNHAGEHGAISIYSCQIFMARITAPDLLSQLSEFRSEEQKHRAIFLAELQRRGCPRCRSYWLCDKAVMSCGDFWRRIARDYRERMKPLRDLGLGRLIVGGYYPLLSIKPNQ